MVTEGSVFVFISPAEEPLYVVPGRTVVEAKEKVASSIGMPLKINYRALNSGTINKGPWGIRYRDVKTDEDVFKCYRVPNVLS